MEIIVEVTLKEMVTPSSPTPPNLRKFKISLLDQLMPLIYTPVIFYYPTIKSRNNNPPLSDRSISFSKLKESLAETLNYFYPLAGRIRDNLFIECNDEGVLYSEAKVNGCLAEFLDQPDLAALDKFLPFHVVCDVSEEEAIQICVQVNVFSCGGIAIGVSLLHKLIDGALMCAFMNTWASIARGSFKKFLPHHKDASLFFPPKSTLPSHATNWLLYPNCSKSRAQRFVFNPDSINKIKVKTTNEVVPNQTSIEAVSAFIWKHVIHAERTKSGSQNSSTISHVVNLRRRIDPTVPGHVVGNMFWKAYACLDGPEFGPNFEPELVKLIRRSLSKINNEYVQKLEGDLGFCVISEWLEEAGNIYTRCVPNHYLFSSWTNMGLYEVDFGWGGPVWVSLGCVANTAFRNLAYFIEGAFGKGIEVWLILEEDEMMMLEQDQEFLALASVNPNVLFS